MPGAIDRSPVCHRLQRSLPPLIAECDGAVGEAFGSIGAPEGAGFPGSLVRRARAALAEEFTVVLRESANPVQAELLGAIMSAARDPDTSAPQWLAGLSCS